MKTTLINTVKNLDLSKKNKREDKEKVNHVLKTRRDNEYEEYIEDTYILLEEYN